MNEDYEFDLKNKQLLPFPLSSSDPGWSNDD